MPLASAARLAGARGKDGGAAAAASAADATAASNGNGNSSSSNRCRRLPIKPPVPAAAGPKPPCGLRSDVDWLAANRASVAAAAAAAAAQAAAAAERALKAPPARALDGKGGAASEYWLRRKPGYGKVPSFCSSPDAAAALRRPIKAAAGAAAAAPAAASAAPLPAGAAAPLSPGKKEQDGQATPLPESERLSLLGRAKARHAALSAQYGRLPLCFAADTPSGLRRREALARALDEAARDVEALGAATRVVVVAAFGARQPLSLK